MKVSLNGLLLRMKGRPDQMYTVQEFLENYKKAKTDFEAGNTETARQFFELYVVQS